MCNQLRQVVLVAWWFLIFFENNLKLDLERKFVARLNFPISRNIHERIEKSCGTVTRGTSYWYPYLSFWLACIFCSIFEFNLAMSCTSPTLLKPIIQLPHLTPSNSGLGKKKKKSMSQLPWVKNPKRYEIFIFYFFFRKKRLCECRIF